MSDSIDLSGVSSAITENTNAINKASTTNSSTVKAGVKETTSAIKTLNQALASDGIKLTSKLDEVKKEINSIPKGPLSEILDWLIEANNTLLEIKENSVGERELVEKMPTENEGEEENPLEKEFNKLSIDSGNSDIGSLGSTTNLPNLVGAGFTVVSNKLDLIAERILESMGQLTQSLVGGLNKVNTAEQVKRDETAPKKEIGENHLAGFLTQLQGPLTSIAQGMILLAGAMALISAVPLTAGAAQSMLLLSSVMIITFGAVAEIALRYEEVKSKMDPAREKDDEGNILHVVKVLQSLIMATAGMLAMSVAVSYVIKQHSLDLVVGLTFTFTTLFASILALSLASQVIQPHLGENSGIMQLVKSLAVTMLTITGVAILSAFLWPTILQGLPMTAAIIGMAVLTVSLVAKSAQKVMTKASKEQINAFMSLLKTVTVLIGVVAVLTIVLGILPMEMVIQGVVTMFAIIAMVNVTMSMLTSSIKKLSRISVEKINSFIGIMLATTLMIGVIAVLTIMLAQQDPAQLMMALGAMVLISSIPIVLIKVLSKISKQAAKVGQAMVGIALAGLVTVAMAGLTWLIVTMLGSFSMEQVLTSLVAVTLTTALVVGISFAIVALAGLSAGLIPAIGFALAALGIASVFVLAVAGLALLLSTILDVSTAKAASQAAMAVGTVAVSLVIIAGAIMLLAVLAIPLMVSTFFATMAVGSIVSFIKKVSVKLKDMAGISSELDISPLETLSTSLVTICTSFVALVPPVLTLAKISGVLTLGLTASAISIALMLPSLEVMSFTLSRVKAVQFEDPTPTFDKLKGLSSSFGSLSTFIQAINSTPKISLGGMLAAKATIDFAASIAKKMSRLGDDEQQSKIERLTRSLNALAGTQYGMSGLAASIRDVIAATEQLNELEKSNVQNVERLTGATASNVNMIQKIEEKTSNTNETKIDFTPMQKALDEMLVLLQDLKTSQLEIAEQLRTSNLNTELKNFTKR